MSSLTRRLLGGSLCAAAGFAAAALLRPVSAASSGNEPLKSQVVRWDDAPATQADWGQMRRYFTGQTRETENVLVAVAVVQPGKAVHRAHRHVMEEYLLVVRGRGQWSLDGKTFPAKQGDILYVEPWVYHGLTNTGDEPLVFAVLRYNGKGVAKAPRPDERPDEL